MIEFTPGTVYDVKHLRPFDPELAKQGHPLATSDGEEVRHFRIAHLDCFLWDIWSEGDATWQDANIGTTDRLSRYLRIAPIAIRDGRPLHVGDVIEFAGEWGLGLTFWRGIATIQNVEESMGRWRWLESKA